MNKYKYRFTLHQVYNYYAYHGDLKWRNMSRAAQASTRTLIDYFGKTPDLEIKLVDYHLNYLKFMYTQRRVQPSPDQEMQLKRVISVLKRLAPCYHFTNRAMHKDLAARGKEIKEIHLTYIKNAMIHGGVSQEKAIPELVFNFFLTPLPEGDAGRGLLIHWMKWFMAK